MIDLSKIIELLQYNPKQPMLFNSALFLILFLLCTFFYTLLHRQKTGRIIFLTIFSLYFYYKSCGYYVGLIVLSAIIDYNLSNWIYRSESRAGKKSLLILSLVLNLGMLAYFKYTDLFLQTLNEFNLGHFKPLHLFLPIGISFYTFENLSYTLDVYRGQFKPINKFTDYLFFLSFFPKLVAGPIVRASDFIPQIRQDINITAEYLGKGLFLIIAGLIKKCIISDYISINYVDRIFDNPTLYSGVENLLGVYGYTLQIYCDFSGYSDIAIGIALWLGFHIPENFNAPYQSSSITEFWRRWHISLSSWLKDYLYISLGGNRKGTFRQYFNLIVTMLLGGLWHGASWKFVYWGGLHGVALAIDKQIQLLKIPKNSFTKVIGVIITFHFVAFCWIYFRADSFDQAQQVILEIVNAPKWELFFDVVNGYKSVFLLMLLGYLMHFLPNQIDATVEKGLIKSPLVLKSMVLAFVVWLVIQTKSSEVQPFIYFQF